jgi:hypothetical protein
MDIVVAKYNEDVSWINKLSNHNVTVYNKDKNDLRWELNLTNYGKDAETHLYHIVKNYDNLAEHTAFLQGNPLEHCHDYIERINNFDTTKDFLPLGSVYKRDQDFYVSSTKSFCTKNAIDYKEPFFFIGGMQIILSKKQIHKRSKDFYLNLKEDIPRVISRGNSQVGNSNEIWWLEYSWPTVFNINESIRKYKI